MEGKNRKITRMFLAGLVLLAMVFVCAMTLSSTRVAGSSPHLEETFCPRATAELFQVEPVTSPTGLFTQEIGIYLGNSDWVTVETESGTFTGSVPMIRINLLPNVTHHLTVTGHVKAWTMWGCYYPDYTLTTSKDRYGAPLTIVQVTDVLFQRFLPMILR